MDADKIESLIEDLSQYGKRDVVITLNWNDLQSIVNTFSTKYKKLSEVGPSLRGITGNVFSYEFKNITLHLKLMS